MRLGNAVSPGTAGVPRPVSSALGDVIPDALQARLTFLAEGSALSASASVVNGEPMTVRCSLPEFEPNPRPECTPQQIAIGGVRRQAGFGQQDRIGIKEIRNVHEKLSIAPSEGIELRCHIEINVRRTPDAVIVVSRELGGRTRAVVLALDACSVVPARTDAACHCSDRESVRVIAGRETVNPLRGNRLRAGPDAQRPYGVDWDDPGDPRVDDVIDVPRRQTAHRQVASAVGEQRAHRHAIACLEINAAHQYAGEIERLAADEDARRIARVGADSSAEIG